CFFQAEDGIRADLVTGVQTCALPIYLDLGLGHVLAAGQAERICAGDDPRPFRGGAHHLRRAWHPWRLDPHRPDRAVDAAPLAGRDRKSVVEGKGLDVAGRESSETMSR